MRLSLFLQQCPACLVHFTWMVCQMGVNGQTAAVLWGVAPRISLKQHVAFSCSSYLAFSSCVLLESSWCIHTVVLKPVGINLVLSYTYIYHIHILYIYIYIYIYTYIHTHTHTHTHIYHIHILSYIYIYIYIYTHTHISSCRASSTYIPDLLLPLLPIVHRPR